MEGRSDTVVVSRNTNDLVRMRSNSNMRRHRSANTCSVNEEPPSKEPRIDFSQRMQSNVIAPNDAMFDLEVGAAGGLPAQMSVAKEGHNKKDHCSAFCFAPPRGLDEAAKFSSCNSSSIHHAETLCIAGWQRRMQIPNPTLPIAVAQPMELEGSCLRIEAIYI